jgi:hypothetical protein
LTPGRELDKLNRAGFKVQSETFTELVHVETCLIFGPRMTRPQSGHARKNAFSSGSFDGTADWTSHAKYRCVRV